MSIDLMSRIPDRDDLDSYEKLVLMIMADRADDDGLLWYANETIARKCSMTVRGVQKVMDRLIARLIVRKMHRHDRSNYYIINADALPRVDVARKPSKERGPIEFLTEEEMDLFGNRGEPRSPRKSVGVNDVPFGVNDVRFRGEPGSPDSLIDPLKTPESLMAKESRILTFVLEGWNRIAEQFDRIDPVETIFPADRESILLRTKEFAQDKTYQAMEAVWVQAFDAISHSKWLLGMKDDWRCGFTWMLGKKNFRKIMGGQYGRDIDRADRGERSSTEAGRTALERAKARRGRNGSVSAGL